MRITKQVVNTIVDYEMTTMKGMKKQHLFQLVRDLIEERTLELDDRTISEYYNDIILGKI
jgi:hypothetical protein